MIDGLVTLPLETTVGELPRSGKGQPAAPRADASDLAPSGPQRFVIGPENALVAQGLGLSRDASAPAAPATQLQFAANPLCVHGPSGIGKTSLLRGIAASWTPAHDEVVFIDAADFARSYADAVQLDDVPQFQQRYQRSPLLLVDNLDHLRKKSTAQVQLARILEFRTRHQLPTVLTIRRGLHNAGLSSRLVSRLAEGLTVPLHHPGQAALKSVLHELCTQRQLRLTPAAIDSICQDAATSVPQMTGLINRIDAALLCSTTEPHASSMPSVPRTIDVDQVTPWLPKHESVPVSPQQVIQITATYFGLQPRNLTSKSRRKLDVLARSIAMYLIREHSDISFQKIGSHFGRRDHTTVMHACKKVAEDRLTDDVSRNALADIQRRLRAKSSSNHSKRESNESCA